jgi:uncharacterized protein
MSKFKPDRFWERIPLHEMTEAQWESICDGCCQCCANKLQDEDTDEIFKTNVVCRYLDCDNCQCTVYSQRQSLVPTCIKVTPDNAGELLWMPETCGYRRLAEGKPLPKWHPLETGDPSSTTKAGFGVTGKVISEAHIDDDDLENFIVADDYFEP